MKKIIAFALCFMLLSGCAVNTASQDKQYTATFIDLFDTVTTVVGAADSEEAFKKSIQPVYDGLKYYHRLFDIYEEYDGMVNLKTLNDKAATAPVKVDTAVIDFLEDCKKYYDATDGSFNHAMGSVLSLWHNAREDGLNDPQNAYLPNSDELLAAKEHIDPNDIVLDRESSTVFFTDKGLKLDVGAVAKGWSVERVCKTAPKNLLISVGGNVYATGPKAAGGAPWAIGIRNPQDENDYLHTLNIIGGSVVTSGSYIRAYSVDGKLYHHIIDPETLYPSQKWTSVTVVCNDSGVADVLSTSLFLLDVADGQRLLDKFNAEAMWVDAEGKKHYSSDFKELIRN